jgi:nitrate reductase NapE component
MTETGETYRSPYAPSTGSSTPGPEVTPAEGKSELWTFFWLMIVNVVIIAAAGIGAWLYIHR